MQHELVTTNVRLPPLKADISTWEREGNYQSQNHKISATEPKLQNALHKKWIVDCKEPFLAGDKSSFWLPMFVHDAPAKLAC